MIVYENLRLGCYHDTDKKNHLKSRCVVQKQFIDSQNAYRSRYTMTTNQSNGIF